MAKRLILFRDQAASTVQCFGRADVSVERKKQIPPLRCGMTKKNHFVDFFWRVIETEGNPSLWR
jgi:hypothetical protein